MSIIDKEDLKYLNKPKNANLKASSNSYSSIIDEADRKYLNNTPVPKLPVATPAQNLMKNINTLPKSNLNLGTSSTVTNTLPVAPIFRAKETISAATPAQSAQLQNAPITIEDTLNNYAQNTRNKMTTGQKFQEDTNKIALEASNNVIRPLLGSFIGAPEKLIRTAGYGTALALGKITQAQYDKIIKEEETGNPNIVGGRDNTISGLIAGDPKIGAAIKLGEDQAYRKIAGAGAETALNLVLPKILTGGGSMLKNTLESGVVGTGYGVTQQAQEQNPDYLKGAGYGFAGGALLSGGISILGKGLGAITSTVEKNTLYKSLANTSNKEEIFNNLKTKFPEVSDNLIQGMSDDLSKINTPKGVEDYFTTITKNTNVTPTTFNENGFRPNQEVSQETPNIVRENVPTKGQLVPEVPNISEPQTVFPKPLKNNINSQNVSYNETIPSKVKTSKSIINPKVDNIISKETPTVKVNTNINEDTFKSRVFERLQKENPDLLQGDLTVSKVNLEKESEKAVKLLKEDKQKLYDIAMGKESSPDLTSTMANITLAEKAIEEGNNELASKLIKNRSLAQTRRGQEIVSEKASLTDNSSSRYIKQLLSDRLDEVGKKYTDNIKDITQKSTKQKAISKIEKDVTDLENRIKNKKIKTSEALALLDKLTCLA